MHTERIDRRKATTALFVLALLFSIAVAVFATPSCKAAELPPEVQAQIAQANEAASAARADLKAAQAATAEANKVVAETAPKVAVAAAALEIASATPATDPAAQAALAAAQAQLDALRQQMQAAALEAEKSAAAATEASARALAAEDASRAAYAKGHEQQIAPVADTANAFLPGVGPLIKWGASAVAAAYALSPRGRKAMGTAVSEFNLFEEGTINPIAGLKALLALPGFISLDAGSRAKLESARDEALREGNHELAAQINAMLAKASTPPAANPLTMPTLVVPPAVPAV